LSAQKPQWLDEGQVTQRPGQIPPAVHRSENPTRLLFRQQAFLPKNLHHFTGISHIAHRETSQMPRNGRMKL
jgi:hypothetical protein